MGGKHKDWPVITVTLPPKWWQIVKRMALHNASSDREQLRLLLKSGLVLAGQLSDKPGEDVAGGDQ